MAALEMEDRLLESLQQELKELREQAQSVAAACLLAADEFDATGDPPREEVLHACESISRRVVELSESVAHESRKLGEFSGDDMLAVDFSSLEIRMEALETKRRENQRKKRHRDAGIQVLDAARAIRHVDDADFAALASVRQSADVAAEQMASESDDGVDSTTTSLRNGEHPLSALVHLLVNSEQMDDAQWSVRQDQVTEAFGRPLAAAVVRGRLVIPDELASKVRDALLMDGPERN